MKFGDIPITEAEGAILAHSRQVGQSRIKKGHVLTPEDIAAFEEAGISTVTVARLEPGDAGEDEAAARVAKALCGKGLYAGKAFTGRANLFAETAGLVTVDRQAIEAINHLHEGLTVATLPEYAVTTPDRMVATIKIIPFALPGPVVDAAEAEAAKLAAALSVQPFQPRQACLIMTEIDGLKESVIRKTEEVIRRRIEALGSHLAPSRRCEHTTEALTKELNSSQADGHDLIMVFGASAIVDRGDVIPAAVEAAGGTIDHFGMPVDPGNLLAIGRIGPASVIGLPGCARSPAKNGFDWVLERVLADLAVGTDDVMSMGVGGLLKETAIRPQRRRARSENKQNGPHTVAIVLAAGRSRRMAGRDKRLEPLHGKPLLRHAVDTALASRADQVLVVTGKGDAAVEETLPHDRVQLVRNPDPEAGIASSLSAGIAALPDGVDCAVICLGDMPRVHADVIDALIAAHDAEEGRDICIPVFDGKRGNPVLWGRRFFPDLKRLTGDEGARQLFSEYEEVIAEISVEAPGILIDVDTEEALEHLRNGGD